MQQDELARLLAQNLTLDTNPPHPEASPLEEATRPQPITYISQHYTHSAHITKTPSTPQTDASEIDALLARAQIDPSALSELQLTQLQHADENQRLNLIEMWKNMPHFEKQDQYAGQIYIDNDDAMVDGMENDSAAVQAVSNFLVPDSPNDHKHEAEPYMVSGYEMLAQKEYEDQQHSLRESTRYNQATDPVYQAMNGAWHKGPMQDMENQYGSYQWMREYGDSSRVHSCFGLPPLDDDMIL